MMNKRLCLAVFRGSSRYSRALSALATSLALFCDDQEVSQRLAAEIEQGRLTVHTQLILDAFKRSDADGKVELATFDLAQLLRPDAFRLIFRRAVALSHDRPERLVKLAGTLGDFLMRNPAEKHAYHDIISAMERHRDSSVNESALELAGLTGFSSEDDWHRAIRWLGSHRSPERLAAVKAFYFALGWSRILPWQQADWRKSKVETRLKKLAGSDRSARVRDWSRAILEQCDRQMKDLRVERRKR